MSSPTADSSEGLSKTFLQNESDDHDSQIMMVDDAGIAPAKSRLGILTCLYGRPRLILALAGILLAQVMGCLDADSAIFIAQVILP